MKYFALIILAVMLACSEKPTITSTPNVSMYDSPLIVREVALNDPYELSLDIKEIGADHYNMITTMDLHGGSFYVSPFSPGGFKGRFTISIENNVYVKLGDNFKESPRSKEVFDPHQFVNGPINWVQDDTRYDHKLIVTSKKDFDVHGKIVFTIEPRCSLEDIPFVIKYRSGTLRIEKINGSGV